MNSIPVIVRLLTDTARTPMMYTSSVETMLMRVTTLLEAARVVFSSTEFYVKHGGKCGSCYRFEIPVGTTFDDWTRQVVDDAIKMIEAKLDSENNNNEASSTS